MKQSLILLLIIVLPTIAFAQPSPINRFASVDFARVDSIFQEFNRKDSPGCALAVIDRGKIIYKKGYGMANLEHNIPIKPATVFDIGSVSKQFTAFAVALLAERGKIALDDDVRKYVPELPDFGKTITIRHLIHHTSGLRDYGRLLVMTGWRHDQPLGTDDFINVLSRQRGLNSDPGERFIYTNTNYALLGLIVERTDGRALADFLKTEVFTPLEMNSTVLLSDPLMIVPDRASYYNFQQDGGFKLNYIWAFIKVMGAARIHTTMEDIAKWDANFYHHRVGGTRLLKAMESVGLLNSGRATNYSFGLYNLTLNPGLRIVSHEGTAGGTSVLMRFPNQKFSVAVSCNWKNYRDVNATLLGEQVADIILAEKFGEKIAQAALPAISKDVPSKKELDKYAGVYWMEASGNKITFAASSGKLTAQFNKDKVFPLDYVSKGRFLNREEGFLYAFSETGDGVISLEFTVLGTTELYKAVRKLPPNLLPEQLKEYTGTFYNEELDLSWSIDLVDGKLRVRRNKFADKVLEPSYLDAFYFSYSDDTGSFTYVLNFQRSKDGTINQFTVDSGRLVGVVFKRAKQ